MLQRRQTVHQLLITTATANRSLHIMVFEQYLEQKNIDSEKFLWANPEDFQSLKTIFNQVNPESFTAQKKFLINKLRRKYQLKTF